MKTIFEYCDPEAEALINPQSVVKPVEGFPERVVATFSKDIVERYAAMRGTDAIYRETIEQIKEKREYGCLSVEMECASMFALAEFRKVAYAQFLFGADSLDDDIWEERDLRDNGINQADRYMELAFYCVRNL